MSRTESIGLTAPRPAALGTVLALLPAIYPLSLTLGVIAVPGGSLLLRAGLIVAATAGILRLGRVTRTHIRWFAVLGVFLGAVALSALAAVDRSSALADLVRQVFLVAVAAGLSVALADGRARTAFAVASVVVALAATVSIVALFVGYTGLPQVGPVQQSFKAFAADRFGAYENAIAFAAVLGGALALPYLVRRPVALLAVAASVGIAVVASGSRTTALSLLAVLPLTGAFLLFHRLRGIAIRVAYGSLAVVGGWLAMTFAGQLGRLVLSPAVDELTTGRSLLWVAAWEKFLERPWFGWGGGSFTIDLGAFLPAGAQLYDAQDLVILTISGGAHNAVLTTLAERGIVGALAITVMVGFLLAMALRVFRARRSLNGTDRAAAWLAPFVVLLILVRSLGESPGWFGAGDSLVDFLAYGFAAGLVALASSLDAAGRSETGGRGVPVAVT